MVNSISVHVCYACVGFDCYCFCLGCVFTCAPEHVLLFTLFYFGTCFICVWPWRFVLLMLGGFVSTYLIAYSLIVGCLFGYFLALNLRLIVLDLFVMFVYLVCLFLWFGIVICAIYYLLIVLLVFLVWMRLCFCY